MSQEFVVYNGTRMIKGWPEKIHAAQLQPTVEIAGIERQRVRYGDEADDWLGTPLPRGWVRELTARAETVYARNAHFRGSLRARGNLGRDRLWAFTRHWLCAIIFRDRPHLHARLPGSYSVGYDLPIARTGTGSAAKRRPPAVQSWAAAAHFHCV